MIVTLAGHVDHGKTTIVRALTGTNTDRLVEEQKRGLTIDLGFAYFDYGGVRVGFVDVPGHHRFIHNMIAGVAKFQHALLVIDANEGVMPQTREHLSILELLGIKQGTIALTKVDRSDQKLIQQTEEQVRTLVHSTFLRDAPIIHVSAITRNGIDTLGERIKTVAENHSLKQSNRGPRVAIDRSFTMQGVGRVVTGTVFDGTVSVSDQLQVSGSAEQVRVRSIVGNALNTDSVSAGDRCGLQITGDGKDSVIRGTWLRSTDTAKPTRNLTIDFQLLADYPNPIQHWIPVHVYHATSHNLAKILPLRPLTPGSSGSVDLVCEDPLDVVVGDRIILRDQGLDRTMGGGIVLDVSTPQGRRRLTQRIKWLDALKSAVTENKIQKAIELACSQRCVSRQELLISWNLSSEGLDKLMDSNRVQRIRDYYIAQHKLESVQSQISVLLTGHHNQDPQSIGVNPLLIATNLCIELETVKLALLHGCDTGKYRHRSGQYALSKHTRAASSYNQALFNNVLPFLSGPQPLPVGDVAKELKIPYRSLVSELKRMANVKVVVQVSKNRYFTPQRLKELAEIVIQLSESGSFTVRDFRDRSGMGRMVGIDVLEYFDRKRFTLRQGDVRKVIGTLKIGQ